MSTPETFSIILSSKRLRCEFLPGSGGKICSLKWLANGIELLQPPLGPCRQQTQVVAFSQSGAGGWDECLLSVASCQIDGASIPDHGNIWGFPSQMLEADEANVKLGTRTASLPFTFTRTLHLSGASLELHYTIENVGKESIPYLWSAHPLFSVGAGDTLRLPAEARRLRVESSKHKRLGPSGTTQTWPTLTPATEVLWISALPNLSLPISEIRSLRIFLVKTGPLSRSHLLNWMSRGSHRTPSRLEVSTRNA